MRPGAFGRWGQRFLLAVTLFVGVAAIVVSSSLVVYTAWLHDLKSGAFALLFAVLSAKIALNWFLWKDEAEEQEPARQSP
ncbi:MAG: hypothetical protein ACR2KW_02120 [Rubrobacter sp.]